MKIVFHLRQYSDWVYLKSYYEELKYNQIVFFTDKKTFDELNEKEDILGHHLKTGNWPRFLYRCLTLKSDYFITTTPDFGNFSFQRSLLSDCRYIYVFHSLISTHYAYRDNAFDAFDTIMCLGPHHFSEIRAREQNKGLFQKNLVPVEYTALNRFNTESKNKKQSKRILIAPTWNGAVLDYDSILAIINILKNDYQLKFRPHPHTDKKVLNRLSKHIDITFDDQEFFLAELLLTDWSGVSFEYSLALKKPVLFFEHNEKRRNYISELDNPVIEYSWRNLFGKTFKKDEIENLHEIIGETIETYTASSLSLNDDLIYKNSVRQALSIVIDSNDQLL